MAHYSEGIKDTKVAFEVACDLIDELLSLGDHPNATQDTYDQMDRWYLARDGKEAEEYLRNENSNIIGEF